MNIFIKLVLKKYFKLKKIRLEPIYLTLILDKINFKKMVTFKNDQVHILKGSTDP